MINKKTILSALALLLILSGVFHFRVKVKELIAGAWQKPLPKEVNFQTTVADKPLTQTTLKNSNANGSPEEDIPIKPSANSNANQPPVTATDTPVDSPTNYNLNVPFTMQAPYSDWSEPWQNTCEEASVLMAYYYYQGKTFTKETAKTELLKLVDWQNKNFGSYIDTTVQQTAEMVEKNWDYKTQIVNNPTIDQIKKFIADGFPVILPADGRALNNPYFVQPGPIYHMIVIKGYTDDGNFITNDPGIGRGHNYIYSPDILMNAMHDWNEADILQGAKRILIIYP